MTLTATQIMFMPKPNFICKPKQIYTYRVRVAQMLLQKLAAVVYQAKRSTYHLRCAHA